MNEAAIIRTAFIADSKNYLLSDAQKSIMFCSIIDGLKKGKKNEKEIFAQN